ncbi:MAG: hypothetical protein ABSC93_32005, partial [Bryobacteraceae bacterium]
GGQPVRNSGIGRGGETVLYTFTGGIDGADTVGSPVTVVGRGNLYGVAAGIFLPRYRAGWPSESPFRSPPVSSDWLTQLP